MGEENITTACRDVTHGNNCESDHVDIGGDGPRADSVYDIDYRSVHKPKEVKKSRSSVILSREFGKGSSDMDNYAETQETHTITSDGCDTEKVGVRVEYTCTVKPEN